MDDYNPALAVKELRAQPVIGSTDVVLTWEQPEESKASSVFKVMRRELNASDTAKWTTVTEEKDIYSTVVTRLKPFTDYEFKVQVLGIVTGKGPTCKPVVTKTNPAAPGDPPSNISIAAVSTDSITISWDPPTLTHGPLTSYHLFFDQESQDDYVEALLTPETTSYTAMYLFPDTQYRFQIYASTAAGDGPHSDMFVCATRPSIASANLTTSSSSQQPTIRTGSISGRPQVNVSLNYDEDKRISTSSSVTGRNKRGGGFSVVAPKMKPKQPTLPSIPDEDSKAVNATKATGNDDDMHLNDSSTAADDENTNGGKVVSKLRASFSAVAPNNSSRSSFSGPMDYQRMEQLQARFEGQGEDEVMTAEQLSKGVHVKQDVGVRVGPDDILVSIKSATKTIRGKKNGVRSKLEVYHGMGSVMKDDELARLFEQERDGSIVVYTSSVEIVRETSTRCRDIRKLFHNMRLKVVYKDISLDARTATEFKKRCGEDASVPQVFVNGSLLGGYTKVMEMNEAGELRAVLQGFEEAPVKECVGCGGKGFVNCTWCQGSKKSIHNPFSKDFENNALKCTVCNEIGLMRCPNC
eukprot:m.177456 g.177456  ORF g.177456 m.177456 type:complete len:580 (+) comp13548_c1_seq1:75-1814(+)